MTIVDRVIMADLAKNGISGTIITGDYLGFNNPRVFTEFRKKGRKKQLFILPENAYLKALRELAINDQKKRK